MTRTRRTWRGQCRGGIERTIYSARLVAIIFASLLTFSRAAQAEGPVPAHAYSLRAHLLPHKQLVRGEARISFRNTSDVPLSKLVMHLYMNAFRDRESVFMRDSRGRLRGETAKGPGKITLTALKIDGVDVLARINQELVPQDQTQLEVELPRELAPGKTARIEARFDTQLPPLFARAGVSGSFFSVAQWFPKPAKLEANGEFASFPYHALGEFYADFADYSLEIKAPKEFVIGASGELVDERTAGNEMVRRFHAHNVHDVAFVAAPDLVVRTETIGKVRVTFLCPDGYELALRTVISTVREGLSHFGKRFGSYPYPTLTVVLPPRHAAGAAGMEYPTFFVTEGSWIEPPGFLHTNTPAFVTAHELAHQWFQGMIASNEVRYPVLDEGLAEWAAIDLVRSQVGEARSLTDFGPISRFEAERLGVFAFDSVALPAGFPADVYTASEYGRTIYARAAIALETIRRVYGKARFERALFAYAHDQRFRHPTPDDLARPFDEEYGEGFSSRVLLPLLMQGKHAAVNLGEARSERDEEGYVTHVRARRTGDVALPTWIAVYDIEGRELARTRFPVDHAFLRTSIKTSSRAARVVIDPDRALLIDPDVRDQVATFGEPPHVGATTRLISILQALFAWVGP